MKSRLNITLEENLILKAKRKAKDLNISLSKIIGEYLEDFVGIEEIQPSSSVRALQIKNRELPEDFNYKKELRETLKKKYVKGSS